VNDMGGSNDQADDARLVVEGLRKEYRSAAGALAVLKGVSLVLRAGRTVAVVGASGSGKSTLLNLIGALDRPTAGSIRMDGCEVSALEGRELAEFRARKVGFVFQDHHLLPQCTAVENVLVPTLAVGRDPGAADRALALLERVGLGDRTDYLPARLSGGERQRVAIARAMINGAPLLLCDEPTGNLDRDTGRRVADLFLELAREQGKMAIVVTHDLELAATFDEQFELRDGTLNART